mgnify:CR=1 FL=1
MPGPSGASTGAGAGPSVPPRAGEGAGRETSSQGLAPDDDESDEEAVSLRSKLSQDRDEAGDGSSSESGADGSDVPESSRSRKTTRRTSQS